MTGPHAVALDAECEVGLKPDRELPGSCVGGVPVVADQRPVRRGPAVVEVRLADELDLDIPVQAQDGANEHVVGVVVHGRAGVRRDQVLAVLGAHGQGVAHQHPAGGRLPRGAEDVRPRLVDAGRGHVDPERPHPERAGLAIEQGAEHAGRVEARHAQPVDRAVRGHERARVAVRQEGVVGDRREGRGSSRALWHRLGRGAHADTHGSCQRPCPATRSSPALGPHDPFS